MNNIEIRTSIADLVSDRRIVILGLGAEGKSSLNFFKSLALKNDVIIADRNSALAEDDDLKNFDLFLGENYLACLKSYDFVMKSPGISFKEYVLPDGIIISSQTELFIGLFRNQIIGITGTKGKSTTSSLIKHILASYFESVFLVGNIGLPALELIDQIKTDSLVVYEMSSHQLEFCTVSPSRAVLLNLYQEHLDHYKDFQSYRYAKWQIALHQSKDDFFFYNYEDPTINSDIQQLIINSTKIPVCLNDSEISLARIQEQFILKGDHNRFNLLISLVAVETLGVTSEKALKAAFKFKGLPHRMEYVGEFEGIKFYNDSIATIPEATIHALKSIENVQTIILGGFDRGIDYRQLIDFLITNKPLNLLLLGKVGQILYSQLIGIGYEGKMIMAESLKDAVNYAFIMTEKGKTCLMSPAASSYDSFKNFEDRGDQFKKNIYTYIK